ncbi:hypothetical protein AWH69_02135 [Janibacter melonis]|uniref:Uncharacterized protein n=1 Tax=Janibacter melonis TaxID=262209 RepID=A0A176QFY5_9MICO|nr:hypothetical protein [Janibacter melonis]OAB88623.1 hypothetical protein AWH69_02135 [Janibacter melonis]
MSTPPPAPPRRGRVRRDDPAPTPDAEAGPPSRGLTVGLAPLLLSVLGLAVVSLVVLLVYLSGRDGPEPAATYTSAATDVVAITGTPVLAVTSASSGPVMTVEASYDGASEGDQYRVLVMSGAAQGDPDAQDFDESRSVTLAPGVSQYRVSVASGVRLCAKARVVRGSSESAWSSTKCEVQR